MRDRGLMHTRETIGAGVDSSLVLEVGPGPGYLGLEWLKATDGTRLHGLEISPAMIAVAQRNAQEYGITKRAEFMEGNALAMPFEDATFDRAFSNGSPHEWAEPERVFDEIARGLKPGGAYCLGDLRCDINPVIAWFMKLMTSRELKAGFASSLKAAYTVVKLQEMLPKTALADATVSADAFGLSMTRRKPGCASGGEAVGGAGEDA